MRDLMKRKLIVKSQSSLQVPANLCLIGFSLKIQAASPANVLVIDVLRELLKKGVFVHFLDFNILFDGIEKEFMLNSFLNFAQQESIDKSLKVSFGHKEGAQKAWYSRMIKFMVTNTIGTPTN